MPDTILEPYPVSLSADDRRRVRGCRQSVLNQPSDDTARTLVAIWLDHHGCLNRAELIREQLRRIEATAAEWRDWIAPWRRA